MHTGGHNNDEFYNDNNDVLAIITLVYSGVWCSWFIAHGGDHLYIYLPVVMWVPSTQNYTTLFFYTCRHNLTNNVVSSSTSPFVRRIPRVLLGGGGKLYYHNPNQHLLGVVLLAHSVFLIKSDNFYNTLCIMHWHSIIISTAAKGHLYPLYYFLQY